LSYVGVWSWCASKRLNLEALKWLLRDRNVLSPGPNRSRGVGRFKARSGSRLHVAVQLASCGWTVIASLTRRSRRLGRTQRSINSKRTSPCFAGFSSACFAATNFTYGHEWLRVVYIIHPVPTMQFWQLKSTERLSGFD